MRALRYALDEALQSLWRGRQSGVLSTLTIAVALFVLGGFLLVTTNLDRLGAEWSRSAELSVYLEDSITEEEARQRIAAQLPTSEKVGRADYVINADGSFEETNRQVRSVHDALVRGS